MRGLPRIPVHMRVHSLLGISRVFASAVFTSCFLPSALFAQSGDFTPYNELFTSADRPATSAAIFMESTQSTTAVQVATDGQAAAAAQAADPEGQVAVKKPGRFSRFLDFARR
jgi:hypothetical protein